MSVVATPKTNRGPRRRVLRHALVTSLPARASGRGWLGRTWLRRIAPRAAVWGLAFLIAVSAAFAASTGQPEQLMEPGSYQSATGLALTAEAGTEGGLVLGSATAADEFRPSPGNRITGPNGNPTARAEQISRGISEGDPAYFLPAFRWRDSMELYSNFGVIESSVKAPLNALTSLLFLISGWVWGLLAMVLNFALNVQLTQSLLNQINSGYKALLNALDMSGITFLIIVIALFSVAKAMLKGRASQVISMVMALALCLGAAYALNDLAGNGQQTAPAGGEGTVFKGATVPVGSPAWIATQGLWITDQVGNTLTKPFSEGAKVAGVDLTQYNDPALNHWTPNCGAYIRSLNDLYRAGVGKKGGPETNAMLTLNTIWLQSYLPNYTRAQYGNTTDGYRAVCHYLEATHGVSPGEQQTIMANTFGTAGLGAIGGHVASGNQANYKPQGSFGNVKDFEAQQFAWMTCYRTGTNPSTEARKAKDLNGYWDPNPGSGGGDNTKIPDLEKPSGGAGNSTAAGLSPLALGVPTTGGSKTYETKSLNDDGSVKAGDAGVSGWSARYGWGVMGSVSGNDCAQFWAFGPGRQPVNNIVSIPLGLFTEPLSIKLFGDDKGFDRFKFSSGSAAAKRYDGATNLGSKPDGSGGASNADKSALIDSSYSTMQGVWGENLGARFLSGLIALITSIVFLWSIGGLALGCVVALCGLVIMLILLPASLLLAATPGARERSNPLGVRMLKMTGGFLAARLVLLVSLILLVQMIGILNSFVTGANIADAGSYLTMLTPLAAVYLMRKLFAAVGMGNLTSVAGSLGMATAGAIALSGGASGQAFDAGRANRFSSGFKGGADRIKARAGAINKKVADAGRRSGQLAYGGARSAASGGATQWLPRGAGKQSGAGGRAYWALTGKSDPYVRSVGAGKAQLQSGDEKHSGGGATPPALQPISTSRGNGGGDGDTPTLVGTIPYPVGGAGGAGVALERVGSPGDWVGDVRRVVEIGSREGTEQGIRSGLAQANLGSGTTVSHETLVVERVAERRQRSHQGGADPSMNFAERAAFMAAAFQAVRSDDGLPIVTEDGQPVVGFVDDAGQRIAVDEHGQPVDSSRGAHPVIDPIARIDGISADELRDRYAALWHLHPEQVLVSNYGTGIVIRPPAGDSDGRRRTISVGDDARDRAIAATGVFFLAPAIKQQAAGLTDSGAALYFQQALVEAGLLDPASGSPTDFLAAAGLSNVDLDDALACDRRGDPGPLDDIVYDLPADRIAAIRAYAYALDSADLSWSAVSEAVQARDAAVGGPLVATNEARDHLDEVVQSCHALGEGLEEQVLRVRNAREYLAKLDAQTPEGTEENERLESRKARARKEHDQSVAGLDGAYRELVSEMETSFAQAVIAEDQCRWLSWAAETAARAGDGEFAGELDDRVARLEHEWAEGRDEELTTLCADYERNLRTAQAVLKQAVEARNLDRVVSAVAAASETLDSVCRNVDARIGHAARQLEDVRSAWQQEDERTEQRRVRHSELSIPRPERDNRVGAWQ